MGGGGGWGTEIISKHMGPELQLEAPQLADLHVLLLQEFQFSPNASGLENTHGRVPEAQTPNPKPETLNPARETGREGGREGKREGKRDREREARESRCAEEEEE